MSKATKSEPRVVTIRAGAVMTNAEVAALRFPERLISSRHVYRNGEGRLVARREFKMSLPLKGGE